MMNEESGAKSLPFFINSTRLRTADSYFEIGRTNEKLRKYASQRRMAKLAMASKEQESDQASSYDYNQYVRIDDSGGGDGDKQETEEIDEDIEYENTSIFTLFWMTVKRLTMSLIGSYFYQRKSLESLQDPKYTSDKTNKESELFVDAFYGDSHGLKLNTDYDLELGPESNLSLQTKYSKRNPTIYAV